MTFSEAMAWQAYRKEYGSFHLGMRLEFGFALLAHIVNRALGGDKSVADFMPHAKRASAPDDAEPADIQTFFTALKAKVKRDGP